MKVPPKQAVKAISRQHLEGKPKLTRDNSILGRVTIYEIRSGKQTQETHFIVVKTCLTSTTPTPLLLTMRFPEATHGRSSNPKGFKYHLNVLPRETALQVAQRMPSHVTNPSGSD